MIPNVTVLLYSGCTESIELNALAAGWNILHYTSTVATDVWTQTHGFASTWITSSLLSLSALEQFVAKIFETYQWKSVLLLLDRTEFSNQWFIGASQTVASSIENHIRDCQIYRRTFLDERRQLYKC
ncbi:uncharacterized protein LOC129583465 [Paramacrobiotus metropolitanus]|uniref:uncharacterized protein LOC129583465 n=1 Tax=Paramacrobiotus metropolitanus TaxID=2943436 RepID=UPI002445741C|nr:uncharacterized protein LOC129583465 [Paramacrobiotus metropolitanus]